jgi:hypothetical protein
VGDYDGQFLKPFVTELAWYLSSVLLRWALVGDFLVALSAFKTLSTFVMDSFYLHCLVYRNMVALRVRFGSPLTGLNTPGELMLLTVPRRCPSIFLRCMSLLFHTALVIYLSLSLFVFLSTVSISPFAPSFISLNLPRPLSRISYTLPLCPCFVGLLINHLFVFFDFLVGYYYFFVCIILVISPSVLCHALCPVLFGALLGH